MLAWALRDKTARNLFLDTVCHTWSEDPVDSDHKSGLIDRGYGLVEACERLKDASDFEISCEVNLANSVSTAYADGVSTGTTSFTVTTSQQLSLANSADFGISISPCLGTDASLKLYIGVMDDIAVFGRALTATEVATLAQ
jgi:hypothetical protein